MPDQQLVDGAWQDTSIPCPDTECFVTEDVMWSRPDLKVGDRSPAEPEYDDTHQWKECVTCGYQTAYVQTDAVSVGGGGDSCQVGIPESVRRAASSHAEKAIAKQAASAPVPLTIGRRPE